MRWKPLAAAVLLVAGVAQVAVAQHRGDGSVVPASGVATPAHTPATRAPVGPPAAPSETVDGGAPASAVNASTTREATPRDPCSEVLHAVQFEDVRGAQSAYAACRARVAGPGRIPVPDDVRTLEDVTEAIHGLRRDDGTFCVEPSAPFDLRAMLGDATDTRTCLAALDRFLASDNAVWRFTLADPYASGRLVARSGFDLVSARRLRRKPTPGSPAERELLAIARLAGRHFMRTCRCMPGPQPDSVTAVRAMHLPSTIEGILLRGLEEREGAHGEP